MPECHPGSTADFENEDSDSRKDQDSELTRSAERFTEKATDLGLLAAWQPTVEITHALEPTFLADHLESFTED